MFKIQQLYAFVMEDPPGVEGVGTTKIGPVVWPLVAADEKRLESILSLGKDLVEKTGRTGKLVRFTKREELETIKPSY